MMRAPPEAKRLPQSLRHNKIRHMIKCERAFERIFRQASRAEQCPCIVDQNVDGRFPVSDFDSHTLHLGQACEIGKIYGVGDTGSASTEPRQCCFRSRLIPRDEDDTSAHFGECSRSDPPIPDVPPEMTTVLPFMRNLAC